MNAKIPLLLATAVLLAALPAAPTARAKDGDVKVEVPMVRPAGAPDGDAHGEIEVEFRPDKNRHELKIEAEDIDTSLTFEAWIEDGGVLTFAANMPLDDNSANAVEIEFKSWEGTPLPFGTQTVGNLAGRAVEVRSGGQTYLTGTIPSIDGGNGGNGGNGSGGGDWDEIRASLTRPVPAPDADAKGYVEVRRRLSDARYRFKVEAEHLTPAGAYAVWLEDAAGSGVLANVGAMPVDGEPDEFELELDTGDGETLPFGVPVVADMAGRRVEVRDGGTTLLVGMVPLIGTPTPKQSAQGTLTNQGAPGQATFTLRSTPKQANQTFELRVKKLAKKSAVDLWLFDAGSASFQHVATVKTNQAGQGMFRVHTKKGQPLPLGALSLDELAGAGAEIREPGTGNVLLAGSVPQL